MAPFANPINMYIVFSELSEGRYTWSTYLDESRRLQISIVCDHDSYFLADGVHII